MPAFASPADEAKRLAALARLDILDTPPDPEFDALARAAALVCGTPIALIGLIDRDRQWYKANVGMQGIPETPREQIFCDLTILSGELLEIPDATLDARVADKPAVTGEAHIRFYVGAPLALADGSRVGTLCAIDLVPRQLDDTQREVLRCLARSAEIALESWHARRAERQAALALQENEARLRRLYEATPALLYTVDPHGLIIAVSDAWLSRLGYRRDEVLGRPSKNFMTAASRDFAERVSIPGFFATGRSDKIEYQMVAKDGEIVDVLLSAILERDAEGQPLHGLAVLQDVTLRRRAERALADEQQRLADLIDATGVGTWEWNVQTGALRVNQRWAEILGTTLDDLAPISIGTRIELMHPDDRATNDILMNEHFAGTRSAYEQEFRYRHRKGHFVWVLSRGRLMRRTPDGAPELMVGTMFDISERKKRDEALRKSEEFLERTGRLAGVGGWEVDLLTNLVSLSAETRRIHGVGEDHVPTVATGIDFYAPEARPVISAAVETAIATGEGFDLELPFIRADGRAISVRAMGLAIFADGRAVRLSGAFQDVTDRVRERQALCDANERVNLAAESAKIGIWDWDIPNERVIWDDWMYRIYGLAPRGDVAVEYEVWRRRLHPDDVVAAETAFFEGRNGIRPFDTEFRVIWDDGSIHHVRGTGRVTCDAAGNAVRMVGTNLDVTEERRLAAELAQQMALQAAAAERELALFRNSPDVLYIIKVKEAAEETDFVYETVSPALLGVTGWRPEDWIGHRPQDCLPADIAQIKQEHFRSCVAKGAGITYSATYVTPLGARDYEGAISPIRDPASGHIVRLAGVLRDVTARNQMQQELHQGRKMEAIGRLAAGVAHDFNNILQSISGCMELVLDNTESATPSHKFLSIALRAASRGSYLTHHLLSYARKQMLRPRIIRLPLLLSDLQTLLTRTLGPNIAVSVRHDRSVPIVMVDPGQLQTALLNLAINASHAMPDGGSLSIEAHEVLDDGRLFVALAVTDTGTGMDAATMAQAVEPFFTTKGLNGTGLGLSMVLGFAEQSGGSISIRSAPNKGTTIEMRLPAALEEVAKASAPETRLAGQSAFVVLVDDDPDVLVTMGAFLESAGFTVVTAADGGEALALLANGQQADAIVTDFAMPGLNGADLITQVRAERPDLPAVIISGYADADIETLGHDIIGLHKPFQRHELIRALRGLLNRAGVAVGSAGQIDASTRSGRTGDARTR